MSDFFLWGGFVFSLLWHLVSWLKVFINSDDTNVIPIHHRDAIALINLGLSGVALCVFGYLAFNTL